MARESRPSEAAARAAAGYETFEHTADVGVHAWAPTPSEAFAQAARGMFAIMLGPGPVEQAASSGTDTVEIDVAGEDWPELLVNWLAELLFLYQADGFIPGSFAFSECAPPRCRAEVRGLYQREPTPGLTIKGVTYHQLTVNVDPVRTEVRVILDV